MLGSWDMDFHLLEFLTSYFSIWHLSLAMWYIGEYYVIIMGKKMNYVWFHVFVFPSFLIFFKQSSCHYLFIYYGCFPLFSDMKKTLSHDLEKKFIITLKYLVTPDANISIVYWKLYFVILLTKIIWNFVVVVTLRNFFLIVLLN